MSLLLNPRPIKEDSWLVRLYPELARFRHDLDRGSAMRAARDRLQHGGRYFALYCLLVTLAIQFNSYLCGYIVRLRWPLIYSGWLYALAPLPIVLAFLAPLLILRRKVCLYLREELRRHGIPICLHCGYDVTGCTSLICPECGTEFKL